MGVAALRQSSHNATTHLQEVFSFYMRHSLRQKITLSYLVVAVLILGISLFAFEELRLVKAKLRLEETVSGLFETALEIRRFERNYFLHRQQADFLENARYIEQLRNQLSLEKTELAVLETPENIARLQSQLDVYQRLMQQYPDLIARQGGKAIELEEKVRGSGKELIALAQDMLGAERRLVHTSLGSLQHLLIISVLVVAALVVTIGQTLSRKVVQPLRQLEENIEAVSSGRLDRFSMPSQDREIASITHAVNNMLQELEARQKQLVRSEKLASLGTMLSGVAHELNNPLSNIWSSCQIMIEELGETDIQSQRELLDQIDEQSVRARNIVRSLLDFARDKNFNKEELPLRALVQEIVKFIKSEIPPKVKVSINISGNLAVFADKQRMQQVFLNLFKNAVEAVGEQGEVTISANKVKPFAEGGRASGVAEKCSGSEDGVEIVIKDSGPGISPEDLPRIFDPFYTTKPVGKGMGLGLFVVHQIIEEHDGCIFVESEVGHGATFLIRLPAQQT